MNMKAPVTSLLVLFVASCTFAADQEKPGYKDTPMQPNGKWHVHDSDRPQPPVVTPGERFTHGAPPPSDAVVLFNGKDFSKWKSGNGGEVKWKIEDDYMEVTPRSGIIRTTDEFGDFQLHLEWATPSKVEGNGQGRGNNGVNIYGLYEVQILDSYNNPTYADGAAAALYGQYPPLVNASKPPGEWQTYDIIFEKPQFEEGKLAQAAYVTVIHNGVVAQHHQKIIGQMAHRIVKAYEPHQAEEPLALQDHDTPVRYRNIWVRRMTGHN